MLTLSRGVFDIRKNALNLSTFESRVLGDKIRNEDAIRPRAVVLLSS